MTERGGSSPTFARAGSPALAKVTRPSVLGIYPRTRLFELLDSARQSPIIWLSAPAGSGKTTTVASYLETRGLSGIWYQIDAGDADIGSFFYHMGLAARSVVAPGKALPLLTAVYHAALDNFSTNYFTELFRRLKKPGVIVIDNYQDLTGGPLARVLRHGMEKIPDGVNIVVVGREAPGSEFVALLESKKIAPLDWNDIRLTEQESEQVVLSRLRDVSVTPEEARNLYRNTQGWVAGLVLLTEHGKVPRTQEPIPTTASISNSIFEYFANEVFRSSDISLQRFLLQTAFLPKISGSLAVQLTGESKSEKILSTLAGRHYFTTKHGDDSYVYHPLFRAFLIERAGETYTSEEIKALKRRSAALLADAGDVEGAIALFLEAGASKEASPLVLTRARVLVAQGRTQTLEAWLIALRDGGYTGDPWVSYWLGICRLPFAPAFARGVLESAFSDFERQNDSVGICRSWAAIVQSYVIERNDFKPILKWLDVYRDLVRRLPVDAETEALNVFTYVSGLANAAFDHPDLPLYAEQAVAIMEKESDPGRKLTQIATLLPYYLWRSDFIATGVLLNRLSEIRSLLDTEPMAYLYHYMYGCLHAGVRGESEKSHRMVIDGLALAERSGVHVFDLTLCGFGIWGHLCAGDVSGARALLERMPQLLGSGGVNHAVYSHFVSLVNLHEGDIERAVDEGRRSALLAKEQGMFIGAVSYTIGFAFALVCQGQTEHAAEVLRDPQLAAERMGSGHFVSTSALCEALIYYLRGETERALPPLRHALMLSQRLDIVAPAYCPRRHMAALYALALDAQICPEYVRKCITLTKLPPPDLSSPNWPWEIRIQTLGAFKVMKGDVDLAAGNAHGKPLELLRALISHGGRNVSIAKLAMALWPETDGDMGKQAVETSLHRLRRLLGEDAIVRHGGELSLNSNCCWLDVWALEQAMERRSHLPRLLELYRGSFMPDDDSASTLMQRERLASKYLRFMTERSENLEQEGKWEEAVTLYQKSVEVDPCAESAYRRLMYCYFRLNLGKEASAVYQRCCVALMSFLRVEPTSETKELYAMIVQTFT